MSSEKLFPFFGSGRGGLVLYGKRGVCLVVLTKEHGAGYRLMKRIKEMLDPYNIMNPGKIFLDE